MNRYRGWIIALIGGVMAILLGLVLVSAGTNAVRYVRENYTPVANDSNTFECRGDKAATVTDISAHERPDANGQQDQTEFLRYGDDVILVGPSEAMTCRVQLDENSRALRSGGFLFLGGAFGPRSPASSSGGSSGGFGAK
ncbi:MAG: DUF4247 domain-containing protein [Dietzia psychralcaliphila]